MRYKFLKPLADHVLSPNIDLDNVHMLIFILILNMEFFQSG